MTSGIELPPSSLPLSEGVCKISPSVLFPGLGSFDQKNTDSIITYAQEVMRLRFTEEDVYSEMIEAGMQLATEAHYGKSRRISGLPYVLHPFATAIAVLSVSQSQPVICAALCHDVYEDSPRDEKGNKIYTLDVITQRLPFGENGENTVSLIESVSSNATYDKTREKPGTPREYRLWQNNKFAAIQKAVEHSPEAILVKTADFLSNICDFIEDYMREGDQAFISFGRSKEDVLERYTDGILQLSGGSIDNFGFVNTLMKDVIIKQIELLELCKNHELKYTYAGWRKLLDRELRQLRYENTH